MRSFDIRSLRRKGFLQPGSAFSWSWKWDGEPYGRIAAHTNEQAMRLLYSWGPTKEGLVPFSYDVILERTPCRFGGTRAWFRCPRCSRRCLTLYGMARDGRFGCRVCLRLGYAGEAEDVVARTWRKQRKLEARLDEDGGRPKGMRSRTFDRIYAALDAVEEARDTAMLPGLIRLLTHWDELNGRA